MADPSAKLAIRTLLYYSPPVRVDTLGGNADGERREMPSRFTARMLCSGKLSKQPRKDMP